MFRAIPVQDSGWYFNARIQGVIEKLTSDGNEAHS